MSKEMSTLVDADDGLFVFGFWAVHAASTVLFAIAAATADPAAACTCLTPGPACQELWNAAAVFVGRVESLTSESTDSVRVTFSVQEWFRGAGTGSVTVRTPSAAAGCGYPFRSGRRSTGLCDSR